MIGHLHTLGNYHCDKSTNNLVFNKVVTTLLTIFFMLVSYFHDFIMSLEVYTSQFTSLTSPPSLTPLWQPPVFSLWVSFIFLNFFMDSTYQWDHIVFVFLCFWLILFNIISTPLSTHVVTNGKPSFSMAEWSFNIYIFHHVFFIHSTIDM